MKRCAIVKCRRTTMMGDPFCPEHQLEFEASAEGRNRRPSSESDFRDRVWKEQHAVEAASKLAQLERDRLAGLKS